ncbi:MAG: ABC transporter permease [Acidimicrobiia bacterium]|nr:ABC transporter permease [Acidimicrobiia bacterium]
MPEQSPDAHMKPSPLESDEGLMGVDNLAVEAGMLEGDQARLQARMAGVDQDPESADILARKKLGVGFWVSIGFLVLIVLAAVFADVLPLAPYDQQPTGRNLVLERDLPPLTNRLDGDLAILGTDDLGRDTLSRIVYGARVSLGVGIMAITGGLIIGGIIGLLAGYFGRNIDAAFMAAMDILLAFPALLLALAIVAIRGIGVASATIALTVVAIPTVARLVRANTLVVMQREFVMAARTLGATNLRVMFKEVFPNVLLALLPFIPLGAAVAIAAEGALAFLGLSVPPPEPSWGKLIADGQDALREGKWWVSMVPCAFLVAALISLNYMGDRLREFFSIKEGGL